MHPTKPHLYCLVLHPPGDRERVITYSQTPFGPIHVGDEVSRWSWEAPHGAPTFGVDPPSGGIVVRVLREVAEDEAQIHDTTYVHVQDSALRRGGDTH
jgi:hypothetical protein